MNSKLPSISEKSCGVILFREDRGHREYLVLHYPGGHWDYPKGHVEEQDANEEETALRELHEETGIQEVQFIQGFREPMYYEFQRAQKEIVKKTVVYFLAKTEKGDVSLSFEHRDFEWLSYEEAKERITYENAKKLLIQAEDFLRRSPHGLSN